MKRYRRRRKPEKLSKNSIKRRLRKALDAIEPLSRDNCNLKLRVAAVQGSLVKAEREIKRLHGQLEKVTENVWSHFRVMDSPPSKAEMELWRFDGTARVAFGVDVHDVRMRPMANRDAWIELIADQFAAKARECALKNLKIISDS